MRCDAANWPSEASTTQIPRNTVAKYQRRPNKPGSSQSATNSQMQASSAYAAATPRAWLRSDLATQTHIAEEATAKHSEEPIRQGGRRSTNTKTRPAKTPYRTTERRRHPLHLSMTLEKPLELQRHEQEAQPVDRQQRVGLSAGSAGSGRQEGEDDPTASTIASSRSRPGVSTRATPLAISRAPDQSRVRYQPGA